MPDVTIFTTRACLVSNGARAHRSLVPHLLHALSSLCDVAPTQLAAVIVMEIAAHQHHLQRASMRDNGATRRARDRFLCGRIDGILRERDNAQGAITTAPEKRRRRPLSPAPHLQQAQRVFNVSLVKRVVLLLEPRHQSRRQLRESARETVRLGVNN